MSDFWNDKLNKDEWYPANGGTETPYNTKSGLRVLYVFNPLKGLHAFLNMDTDMIIPNEEIYLL